MSVSGMTYTWIVHVSEWYDVYLDSSCQVSGMTYTWIVHVSEV